MTQPSANGVTYNREASITTDFGNTCVSLDNQGGAFIEQNGRQTALAAGVSIDLGNGESVRRDRNGTVLVSDTSAAGGTILTTLRENGSGVDVNARAQNVDLGGDLLGDERRRTLTNG